MADKSVSFYTDVHIALPVVEKLRESGVTVVRAEDLGLHDATDKQHLETARAVGHVIVTKDADFLALHRLGFEHCGIAFFRQSSSIGYILEHLLLMHAICSADDMRGKIEYF